MNTLCNNLAMMLYLAVFAFVGKDNKALTPFDKLKEEDKKLLQGNPLTFLNKALGKFLEDARRSDEDKAVVQKAKDKINSSRALSTLFPVGQVSDVAFALTFVDEYTADRFVRDAFNNPDAISKARLFDYGDKGVYARRAAAAIYEGEPVAVQMLEAIDNEPEAVTDKE